MIPNIIIEKKNLGLYILGTFAWYNPETNKIYILEGVRPKWLAILHELGHWLIGYFPEWLHLRISLDYEYDCLWERLGLSNFFKIGIGDK